MGPLWVQVGLALLAQVVGARDEDNRLTNNNKEVVTLRTPGAFLETLGREGDSVLNVSIEVRTYQQSGLLLYHQLGKKGHVRLSVSEGVVAVEVVIGDDSSVHLAEWGSRVDDGGWHQVRAEIEPKCAGCWIFLPDMPNFKKNIFSKMCQNTQYFQNQCRWVWLLVEECWSCALEREEFRRRVLESLSLAVSTGT